MAEPTLFDEASLALIASGGAGKDGKVYSVKPVPVYGPESVTNGDFATDSDWTKGAGVTISGEKCQCLNTTPYNYALSQIIQLTVNKTYLVSYEILDYVSGEIRVRLGSNMGTTRSSNGVYQEKIVAQNTDFILQTVASSFTGSIDNVSVKEVLVGDGDFTFSRGSNLAATRVGPTGLIEKGRENLLLQSNQFDTTWNLYNGTLTSGQSGYDGTSDAWLLDKSGSDGRIFQSVSFSGVTTFSVYAKANTNSWIRLYFDTIAVSAFFDLANGVEGTSYGAGLIDLGIESVGNGWYRCSVLMTGSGSSCRIYTAEANSTTATSGSIYIQDAQLEIGLAATDYIESGATTGKAGLLEDEPRFDYSGGATCPSLLLEPSRTNLINYSEYFGSGWSLSNISATYNYSISPEGLKNATLMSPTTNDAFLREMSNSFTSGGSYTASIYMKSNSGSSFDLNMRLRESGGGQDLIETKTITTEWQRFEISITATITGNYQFWIGTSGTWSLNEDLLIWGAQLEAGSYPTSYIPNHSGGSVTRGAETNIVEGISSAIGQTEGTLYGEVKFFETSVDSIISLSDGTNENRLLFSKKSDNKYALYVQETTTQVNLTTTGTFALGDYHKFAVTYKANDFKLYVDGNLELSATSGSVPVGMSQLEFYNPSGSSPFNGNVKQVLVFKEALSETELIKLTTI